MVRTSGTGAAMWRERALAAVLAVPLVASGPLQAAECSRADFEGVVGEAAQALRALNLENKPRFQGKLRQLMAKRGWSHDEFLAAAAPIVQDQRIGEYDEKSAGFLSRIEQLGAEGTAADRPDCTRLAEVRQAMTALVAVQKEKWAYMFAKIEGELAK